MHEKILYTKHNSDIITVGLQKGGNKNISKVLLTVFYPCSLQRQGNQTAKKVNLDRINLHSTPTSDIYE